MTKSQFDLALIRRQAISVYERGGALRKWGCLIVYGSCLAPDCKKFYIEHCKKDTYYIRMARHALHKERWTLTFDPVLKKEVLKEARRIRVYPVQLLESLVREQLNPYGFKSVRDSIHYVNSIRKKSRLMTDSRFLRDLRKWQK